MHAAIVTGVSRGLGESLAARLLARDFLVQGIGRSSSERLGGERYRFTAFDLANAAAIDTALRKSWQELVEARPESVCLINNAATAEPVGVLGALDDDEIARGLALNLAAPIALANLFCRVFNDEKLPRRIINVSSGAAQMALPGGNIYSIAKAGLEMLTKALVAEQRASTFRAITVRPGIIDTAMQAFMRSQSKERLPSVGLFEGFHKSGQLVAPDVVAAKIVDRLIMARVEQGRTYSYQEL